MSHRFRRIAMVTTITAALLGFVAAEASATEPPGPCTVEEIGQSKIGPDGATYTCMPVSDYSQA